MKAREVKMEDIPAIHAIYTYYIAHTTITFETERITEEEMRRRVEEIHLRKRYPYLVGEVDGHVVGYCYLDDWKTRKAYAQTKEITIYLDKDEEHKGYGTILMEQLIHEAVGRGYHVLIGCICIPNEGSVHLHEKFGFRKVGEMTEVGRKFDQWLDIGLWQLTLE